MAGRPNLGRTYPAFSTIVPHPVQHGDASLLSPTTWSFRTSALKFWPAFFYFIHFTYRKLLACPNMNDFRRPYISVLRFLLRPAKERENDLKSRFCVCRSSPDCSRQCQKCSRLWLANKYFLVYFSFMTLVAP